MGDFNNLNVYRLPILSQAGFASSLKELDNIWPAVVFSVLAIVDIGVISASNFSGNDANAIGWGYKHLTEHFNKMSYLF